MMVVSDPRKALFGLVFVDLIAAYDWFLWGPSYDVADEPKLELQQSQ
jgi:hypothetical protein